MGHRRYSEDRPPLPGDGYLEDYTIPFLVMAGILTFILLFVIWAAWGFAAAVGLSVLADRFLLAR